MDLNSRMVGPVCVVELRGRFDAHMAPALKAWHERTRASSVVVNMAGVTFVDSTALAALVGAMKRCRQDGGDLRLCALQQPVRIIFELTRMNRAFEVFDDEATAIAAFAA